MATPSAMRAGALLWLDTQASVQFTTRPIRYRVIRLQDWDTYDGWIWLDGYELDAAGDAIERRAVFVLIKGVRLLDSAV